MHVSVSNMSVLLQNCKPGLRHILFHAMHVCSHLHVILHVHYHSVWRLCARHSHRHTWSRNGDSVVGWVSAQLQTKLRDFVVDMLWQTHICIYVIDVDPLHGMLCLGDGLQALL